MEWYTPARTLDLSAVDIAGELWSRTTVRLGMVHGRNTDTEKSSDIIYVLTEPMMHRG